MGSPVLISGDEMAMEGLLIEYVSPGSIAEELELEAGDTLLMINGQPLRDIIDYNYLTADDELLFVVRKKESDIWEVEFDKDEDAPLGIFFPPPTPSSCGNSCIFCFVHQLPKGLRKPLYVKDEDYRLSFLYGNYITLTNITGEELERIKEQRLSPLYISVHATEPKLRELLLGRSSLRPVLETVKELAASRITMHAQVVLCPGLNDGRELERTVEDLAGLYPHVASLAVVPLGLTRHRKGLTPLQPVTSEYAREFISGWLPRQEELQARLGGPFLFLADEFFIKAGFSFPPLESYGDLPQLENGVGMVPLFLAEADQLLGEAAPLGSFDVTVVTGVSAGSYVSGFTEKLSEKTGVKITTIAVPNGLFGGHVTVTGLVAGSDIVAAFKGGNPGQRVLVPDVMLKEGEGLFLDELSLADLEKELGCPVEEFGATPWGLYEKLREIAG